MSLVDHQPRRVPLLNVNQPLQVWYVAIHTVKSLHDNQRPLKFVAICSKQSLEIIKIVVSEAAPSCAGKHPTHCRTVVDDRIANQKVFRTNELPDHAEVCGIAAHENYAILTL